MFPVTLISAIWPLYHSVTMAVCPFPRSYFGLNNPQILSVGLPCLLSPSITSNSSTVSKPGSLVTSISYLNYEGHKHFLWKCEAERLLALLSTELLRQTPSFFFLISVQDLVFWVRICILACCSYSSVFTVTLVANSPPDINISYCILGVIGEKTDLS